MPLIHTEDGEYLFAIDDHNDTRNGRPQWVVYRGERVVIDRHGYEAVLGESRPQPPPVPPPAVRPDASEGVPVPSPVGGGIVEAATSSTVRPRLSRTQIASFMPYRGRFTFPAPYGTRGIRLTNASHDLVHPLGMSYWPNINQHAGRPTLRVLLSLERTLAVLTVDKATGDVSAPKWLPFSGTGEGVYWSVTDPDALYVPQTSGLLRYNVMTHHIEPVVSVTGVTTQFHSSADGTAHSFTLNGQPAAWYANDLHPFTSTGYDECQITKSGRYLLIKEHGDNRVIDLHAGREWPITDAGFAVGHSDTTWNGVIGEEDQTNPGGVFRHWDFTPDGPMDSGVMYSTDWTAMSRYVSACNAKPAGRGGQRVLFSGSYAGDALRANELVVARLDGSLECRTLAPNLNDLDADDPHGADNKYWRKTRANICPVGEYACLTGNLGTERVDAFLVELT